MPQRVGLAYYRLFQLGCLGRVVDLYFDSPHSRSGSLRQRLDAAWSDWQDIGLHFVVVDAEEMPLALFRKDLYLGAWDLFFPPASLHQDVSGLC